MKTAPNCIVDGRVLGEGAGAGCERVWSMSRSRQTVCCTRRGETGVLSV